MGSRPMHLCHTLHHFRPTTSPTFHPSASPPVSSSFRPTPLTGARRRRLLAAYATLNDSDEPNQQQQQLNLSVLRFTLGIPGLDESYLPRWIGLAFGSLLLLNHFLGSDSVAPVQLTSEVLGLCLAGFSVSLPYLGKFLKGANLVERATLPEGNKQIFVMPENLSDEQREDLAWGSYVLLKNTNTMSALIFVQSTLCARGYWSTPEYASNAEVLDWFRAKIQQIGLSDLKETLYFPQNIDSLGWEILPNGTLCILVQPIFQARESSSGQIDTVLGFMLLASNVRYGYSDRDRAWIKAIANKFKDF